MPKKLSITNTSNNHCILEVSSKEVSGGIKETIQAEPKVTGLEAIKEKWQQKQVKEIHALR